MGCHETSQIENASFQLTQSEITSDESSKIIYDEVSLAASLPVPEDASVVSESAPPLQQLYVRLEKVREKQTTSHDTISLSSQGK